MDESLHYNKAPITEAIIELHVSPRAELSLEELCQLQLEEEENYPQQESIREVSGRLEVHPNHGTSTSSRSQKIGFKQVSKDKKHIWQSRLKGFAFSRLAPYESWEPFQTEAMRLWLRYREQTQPQKVTRLAVRFINRIDIPNTGEVELKDYFRTSPEVSADLPQQQLSGFFMQLQISQIDLPGSVLINQTMIPPVREGVISVVLDIDVFRDIDVPQKEEEIWDFFELLHGRKNDIFEACITDSTRELIK